MSDTGEESNKNFNSTPLFDHLRKRCSSGIGEDIACHRPPAQPKNDDRALSYVGEVREYELIPRLMSGRDTVTENDVEESIVRIARHLSDRRDALFAVIYNPLGVIPRVRGDLGTEFHQWAAWCWTSEAAWRVLDPKNGEFSHPLTENEVANLAPIAARQRFLAWSEAYRTANKKGDDEEQSMGPPDTRLRILGKDASHLLHTYAREARQEWAWFLCRHESLPALDGVGPRGLERETDLLLFKCPNSSPASTFWCFAPMMIHANLQSAADSPTQNDRDAATALLETHHLPRFRLWTAAKASLSLTKCPGGAWFWAGLTAVLAVGTVFLSLSAFALLPLPPPDRTAMWAAPVTVALDLIGVAVFGRLWAMPWMLRVPAAAAIGLLMLTTMNPAWWHAAFAGTGASKDVPSSWSGPHPLCVALLLATAAFAYLLVNVRNTGVDLCMALGRALAVWVVSAVHSVLVALFGLTWVVPLFSEDGDVFVAVWSGHPEAAITALLQAGAWCLVAGVFSQILWDDRPLTTPLAHAHWRAEER
ncbi:hypothetical protein GCM10007147_04540 [Nocardiopsis kunsanensis]|uniref:Uncharacterized protein n=1 Tax=Nocardiopsis kunsanensis TaxID=141693 RepID=A0A918X782_9ACTN|nr:hypothetical protein [Nocardiopsis kunsanensis]GHD16441.1 hypothetical protein GCM10007147_04540 [Nocardiopsis kunsanensis]